MRRSRIRLVTSLLILLLIGIVVSIFINKKTIELTNQKISNVIGYVLEQNPNISEEEIINIIKSDSNDFSLEKYGYYDNASIIGLDRLKLIKIIFIILFVFAVLLITYINDKINEKYIKRNISKLSKDLDYINRGIYNLSLKNEEDDFSKLQNQLYKITLKLKQESIYANDSKLVLQKSLEDISHQIKTPLTAINLLVDLLNTGNIDNKTKLELIDDLQKEVEAITNLIYMLLNIAILDSNTEEMKKDNINVHSLINESIELLQPFIREYNTVIKSEIDKDIYFIGDRKWEKEVYINLIKNAIEHSADNFVEIDAKNTNSYTLITVKNRGESIPKEYQSRIFERYFRLNKTDRNFGIGLNLCKIIVEKDFGKIYVHSKDNETKFFVKYFKMNTF